MIDPTRTPDGATAPWWEAVAEGAEVPVALVRIERADGSSEHDEPTTVVLRRQAQFTAGVEYIARAFGAAEPLVWEGGGATLVLGGDAVALPERAYLAARELWERARIDLDLPVRIGAHVGHVRLQAAAGGFEGADVTLCQKLASVAPTAAVALSEDVALALPDDARGDLAALGVVRESCVRAFVLPAGMASKKDPAAFAADVNEVHWDAFRRYALGREVRELRYVGFRLLRNEPPVLDVRDVFILPDTDLRPRQGADTPGSHASRAPDEGRKVHREPTGPVAVRDLFAQHRSIVVLGDPGAGKTTLVRWLAVMAAGGRYLLGAQAGVAERLLPLPVSVGRLAELRQGAPDADVVSLLSRYYQDRNVGDAQALGPFLTRTLAAGQALVLLDGLDEVQSDEREAVHRWLAAFAAEYPENRFVATARIVGFTGIALPDVVEATLRPLDGAQIDRYVRAFTTAYARWEVRGDDEGRGAAEAERLLVSLRENRRLSALAGNPFLLSALALVHRAEGRLPRHRVQAYTLFARALCETWANARRLVAGASTDATIAYEEEALPILGQLALAMHRRYPAGVAPERFVVETLASALEERRSVQGDEATQAARSFLDRAGRDVQIVLERGAGDWGFLHLTFQEFFAAAGLHAMERFEEEAFAHLFDPRWEEVLRLGVGYMALEQKRPEAARRFVQKVLEHEAPEPEGWVTRVLKKQVPLAALLAAEAGDALPEGLMRRVAEALAEWVTDPPSSDRARECLEEIGTTDFGALVETALAKRLQSEDATARRAAAAALGDLGVVDAVAGLMNALGDADSRVRRAAGEALLRNGSDDVVELLGGAAKDIRPEVRAEALAVLVQFADGDERIALLMRALADVDAAVRLSAMSALTRFPFMRWIQATPELAPLLLPATHDDSAEVRTELAAAFWYLRDLTDVANERLMQMAKTDPDITVRQAAASAVATVASPRVVDTLFALLLSPSLADEDVDIVAGDLAKSPRQDLVEARLSSLLTSEDPFARARAAWLLAQGAGEQAWRRLVDLMADAAPTVRAEAAESLHEWLWHRAVPEDHQARRGGVDALLRLLGDDDEDVRGAATWALCRFVDEHVLQVIKLLASDPTATVRSATLGVVFSYPWEKVAPLVEGALVDPDREVREQAVSFLCHNPTGLSAVPGLLQALPTIPAAREALWNIAERLHHPDPRAA